MMDSISCNSAPAHRNEQESEICTTSSRDNVINLEDDSDREESVIVT
ncbi:hypothetical protein A3Q56_08785 [Intoshia linei]|uniref:Uncharacterized protein n=1 Tax=Intoshia linei TaxID=1819745 RepID=A0A177AQG6_9BILA|nr:hypothetical protein A3Q56_08785 [Intoshia linei]